MSDQDSATRPAREEKREELTQQTSRPQPDARSGSSRDRERGRRRHQQPNQPRRSDQQLPMDELRDLFALFTEHSLTEFEIEREGFRVHLGRNPTSQGAPAQTGAGSQAATPALTSAPQVITSTTSAAANQSTGAQSSGGGGEEASVGEDESLHIITSPIVGTFYRSPSPAAEPFVRLGSHVDPDSTVCIIEAMKLMNEIQSETTGEIAKIYVENGQPVEFGQPLFGVRK
jgi:acetyl-CoA carboxylase biotin carboxyl carrier protein